jgi:ATP-dependent RNA helicase DDX55/SPB4
MQNHIIWKRISSLFRAVFSVIRHHKEWSVTQSPDTCLFCLLLRFASLDLGRLATSFCLLRLPKMPELREDKGKLQHFVGAGPEVSIFSIPYLDKAREAARQKRLAEELAAGGKNAKQIKAEQRKADQLRRQQEKRQKAVQKGRNPDKKRGRHEEIVDEWDDLAKEERLYKKMRRGKITKDQYEALMRGGSSDGKTGKKALEPEDDSSSQSD